MIPRIACIALAALTFAPPAAAEATDLIAALDTNGDGLISREEFLVLRQKMFARIDANGSGTLTKAEVDAAREASAKRRQQRAGDIWSQDKDGDGELTLTEFTSHTPGFDRADHDGDGALSGAEIDRVMRLIGSFTTGED